MALPSDLPSDLFAVRASRTRVSALALDFALIMLGLAWELWLAPTGRGTWAMKVVPLLLPLPGLWKGRLYTFRWLSLLVWFYFTEGVVRSTSEHGVGARLATVEVALSLGLFVVCALHVRASARAREVQP